MLRRDAFAVGTIFGTMGFMRPVLHYRWRAWPSTFSSVLLVAGNEWLEKKLLRSLPCRVACRGCCEPRCSRSERVCVPLCLRCGVFALNASHSARRWTCGIPIIPIADAKGTMRNIMLPLSLLYQGGLRCHCHSFGAGTRSPRPLQAQGFSSADFAFHSHMLLTHNHDNDKNMASGHSALLSLSFAVAMSLRKKAPHPINTMGQCASSLRRRKTAANAPASTPSAWLMELQEFFDWVYTLRALVCQRRTPGYSSDDTSLSLSSAPVSNTPPSHHDTTSTDERLSHRHTVRQPRQHHAAAWPVQMATARAAATAARSWRRPVVENTSSTSSSTTTLTAKTSTRTSRPLSRAATKGASSSPMAA